MPGLPCSVVPCSHSLLFQGLPESRDMRISLMQTISVPKSCRADSRELRSYSIPFSTGRCPWWGLFLSLRSCWPEHCMQSMREHPEGQRVSQPARRASTEYWSSPEPVTSSLSVATPRARKFLLDHTCQEADCYFLALYEFAYKLLSIFF